MLISNIDLVFNQYCNTKYRSLFLATNN